MMLLFVPELLSHLLTFIELLISYVTCLVVFWSKCNAVKRIWTLFEAYVNF